MSATMTARDIDPRDKAWVQREARLVDISTEEFIRRVIREKRARAERRTKPSDAFRHYFGTEHGVELLLSGRPGQRRVELTDGKEA